MRSIILPPADQVGEDPIGRTITFMKENLSQSLKLEDLATIAGMSASHYLAVFREKVQSPPINFFTFLKIQEACRLLENTQLRIKEVAYQLGYADPYHFSRVFANVMGVSPPRLSQVAQGVRFRSTERLTPYPLSGKGEGAPVLRK